MDRKILQLCWAVLLASGCAFPGTSFAQTGREPKKEAWVSRATYSPFFRDEGEGDKAIGPIAVDVYPVTNAEFRDFVLSHPQWKRSNAKRIFAESSYLHHWDSDESFPDAIARQPVVNVSWFAARKYCESQGKRLMTVAEWEYVSDAQNLENLKALLAWYEKPDAGLRDVGGAKANRFGLHDMHGLVWEWVEDFSSVIIAGDSRSSNDAGGTEFCGAGSLRAKDPSSYATFLRFAHRSSLKGPNALGSLGFRCARDVSEEEARAQARKAGKTKRTGTQRGGK